VCAESTARPAPGLRRRASPAGALPQVGGVLDRDVPVAVSALSGWLVQYCGPSWHLVDWQELDRLAEIALASIAKLRLSRISSCFGMLVAPSVYVLFVPSSRAC
jgi:hypothetical protein